MPAASSHATVGHTWRRFRIWLDWLAIVALVVAAFGYFIVRPAVERIGHGATSALGGFLEAAAVAVRAPYEAACQQIQQSQDVVVLLGVPVHCAPLEEVTWLKSSSPDKLEFEFTLTGGNDIGKAHVIAAVVETEFQVKQISVSVGDDHAIEISPP